MGKQENIEQTILILESIVERANIIHSNPNRELCLDIDLMLEDLRLLYRRYEVLRKQCESAHTTDASTQDLAGRSGYQNSPEKKESDENSMQTDEESSLATQSVPSFFTDAEEDNVTTEDAVAAAEAVTKEEAVTTDDTVTTEDQKRQDEKDMAESPNQPVSKTKPLSGTEVAPAARSLTQTPQSNALGPDASSDQVKRQEPSSRHANPNTGAAKGNNGKSFIDLFSQDSTPSIGDRFGREDNSLHQRISSQKEDKSIGARLQQHPIDNIKDAIGLNEKFLFINELFNGDIQAYNDAIAKLNNIGSLQKAFDYLNEISSGQNVDAKRSSQTIEKLASFVQRKYMNG